MIDLTNIIKSKIFLIICIAIILISAICVIVYLAKKYSLKRKLKQNTKELNDTLTMEILDEKNSPVVILPEKDEQKVELLEKNSPVVIIDNNDNKVDIIEELGKEEVELLSDEPYVNKITENSVPSITESINKESINTNMTIDEQKIEQSIVEEDLTTEKEEVNSNTDKEINSRYEINKEENLVYAPIELDEEEAKEELERLTLELTLKEEEQEEIENVAEEKSIELTNFEKEQEENAIISLDELMSKATDIYNKNEAVQYDDEGDEPITIEQLQAKWEKEQEKINQIKIEEKIEEIEKENIEEIKEEVIPAEAIQMTEKQIEPETKEVKEQIKEQVKVVKQVEFPSILPSKKEAYDSKFKNSPIISPVYGIERKKAEKEEKLHPELVNSNELALENTANYDKFDEEIRKTNEFIAALKELQKKLD